jgi:zinc and cadmium transporter
VGGFSRDPVELKVQRRVLRRVMVLTWILGFALLGSVGAIAAAATFLLFPKATRARAVPFLISYAIGTLLGLLPQAVEQGGRLESLASVLVGLIVFFVLERLLIWRHCHHAGGCVVHGTAGQLILVGDALHYFVDGIVISAAFLSSIPLGIATGIAVIAHELPQEVGISRSCSTMDSPAGAR